MSTLKADTIQSTGGGAATLTKQEALKQWISWDGVNNDIEGSLNVSSVLDEETGVYKLSVTSAFSSQHNRCILTSLFNTDDDGANAAGGATRGLSTVVVGSYNAGADHILSTTSIQYATAYGSTGSSNAGMYDPSKVWVSAIGDLA